MAMDFDALVLQPNYAVHGLDAVLTTQGSDGDDYDVTVIDNTDGIEVADDVGILSIKPAADIRNAELLEKGIDREELDGARLIFDGNTWTVRTHGLLYHETRLYLSAEA